MARRRAPSGPVDAHQAGAGLSPAEVAELGRIAARFSLAAYGDHVLGLDDAGRVAAIAGGPVEDFTGPRRQSMPLELWPCCLAADVPAGLPPVDQLVEAVRTYRRRWP